VATNVLTDANERALGTRVSADVAQAVLDGGRPWQGRAFVVNDWYVAAYEPVRNRAGRTIGMLYVGTMEAPFLASRTQVMLTFLVVCLVGLVIVFALTYVITRKTISPLEEMVAATRTIADGNLDVRVRVTSRDEIGDLAAAFNDMLESLRATKSELEQWGRTLEEKVKERTEVLVAVQARMAQSEKLASIGRLAAGVAHSINNPLGGILSLSMLALEDCDASHPLRKDLETIVRQTERCREIVKGLLDFSHQSAARIEPTDVSAVVDSALSLLQRQAVFQNIRLVRHAQADTPRVLIDPGQLQEVVSCLVLNAIDAMEESGTLTVETSAETSPAEVIIRVGDTGPGIPPDLMPLIFEPFFTTKKVGQGTGLGLAIAHGIVTRAGGRVDVASSPDGATFTVRLPVAGEEVAQ
jgi:two-component system NtrC family sensor kinase